MDGVEGNYEQQGGNMENLDKKVKDFEDRKPHEEFLPATAPEKSPIEVLAQMTADPNVNVDKMERFVDLQKRIWDYQAEHEYNKDMVLCQAEMPIVPKDTDNKQTNSRYPKLETIIKHTKPTYTKHGFAVEFYEGESTKEDCVRTMADIKHRGGHSVTRYIDIPVDDKGPKGTVNKTKTHAKVSSITYGRSRLLRMIFNISDSESDDDGNAAGTETIDDQEHSRIKDMIDDLKDSKEAEKATLRFCGVEGLEFIPKSKINDVFKALIARKAKEKDANKN
jgi:hypothetical protein